MSQLSARPVLSIVVPLDVAKELSDILTSAFGKGWGLGRSFLLGSGKKKNL
jgi:hypothetical protein